MTLNFYTLGVIYLVYSFLGWVAETVVATIRGGRFANRGAAAGPFCFIYGTTGVLLAVSFGDLRTEPVYLFFACMMAATVMEWITAKLLERLHRRKWWDYSGKKFNLNGYVCLQYSLLWGALGTASVLWGNNVLLQLCAHIPVWLLRPAVWVSLTVAVLDQIGSAVLVQQYAARHPMLEQLNQRLGERSDTLRRRIALYIEKRIQYAYPAAARQEQTALRKGEKNFLSVSDLLWLFVIGAFLGDMVETVFCRVTAGVWMSRSSLVWGPFSVVWGLALVLATVLLRQEKDKSDRYLFAFGTVMGGVYEYVCSAVTELLFGTVFWDYSKFKFNLGGRINLLYCFFWGIAAVIWMRYGYPLVLRGMKKVRSRVRPWMTVLLAVFMAVNMLTSALALVLAAILLRGGEQKSESRIFWFGVILGGAYEYVCSAVTELLFGTVFWDYSGFKFNLGGRINLLYCFFWGIAAVTWIRYGYPLVAKGMKAVKRRIRPWMTALLAVFMAVNLVTSALALARYDARTSGEAPKSSIDMLLDAHFDDARMERIYPNAKKVAKAG